MHPAHHHGRIFVGRIIVAVACLLVLGVDVMIYQQADAPPYQFGALKGATVITFIWMFAGAWGMCIRTNWSRPLVLTILYGGSIGFFLLAVVTLGTADASEATGAKRFVIAAVIYFILSQVVAHSKDVRRLTSRAYE